MKIHPIYRAQKIPKVDSSTNTMSCPNSSVANSGLLLSQLSSLYFTSLLQGDGQSLRNKVEAAKKQGLELDIATIKNSMNYGEKTEQEAVEILDEILKLNAKGSNIDSNTVDNLILDYNKTESITSVLRAVSNFSTVDSIQTSTLICESENINNTLKIINGLTKAKNSGLETNAYDAVSLQCDYNSLYSEKANEASVDDALAFLKSYTEIYKKGANVDIEGYLDIVCNDTYKKEPINAVFNSLATNIDKISIGPIYKTEQHFLQNLAEVILATSEKTPTIQKICAISLIDEIGKNCHSNDPNTAFSELIGINLDKTRERLQRQVSSGDSAIPTDGSHILEFQKKIMANNSNVDEILSTMEIEKFRKNGLPLEYTRAQYLSDLSALLKDATDSQQSDILEKLQMLNVTYDEKTGNIKSFEGIMTSENLNENSALETQIYQITHKFLHGNSVISNDKTLNETMNALIGAMPEFTTVIGKSQHATQNYNVDIHILKVLKEATAHPEYNSLPNREKTILKYSILMHDLGKKKGIIDNGHENLSAQYANEIMNKFNLSDELKNRVYYMVKNHHWLKEYNTKEASANNIAARFRAGQDYQVAKIMASADLKGVSDSFYEHYKNALSKENQKEVEDALLQIKRGGAIILPSRPVYLDRIPTVEHEGASYKMIDFTKMPDGTDLSNIGYHGIRSKKDVNLLVHMLDNRMLSESAHLMLNMEKTRKKGAISASLISPEHKDTYRKRNFGFALETNNYDIAVASDRNISSGREKDFDAFCKLISKWDQSHRILYAQNFQLSSNARGHNIDANEYAKLFDYFQGISHYSQISENKTYTFGKYSIKGNRLKDMFKHVQKNLLVNDTGTHNELVVFGPKVSGIVAKVDNIKNIPEALLQIARRQGLVIYLLGKE